MSAAVRSFSPGWALASCVPALLVAGLVGLVACGPSAQAGPAVASGTSGTSGAAGKSGKSGMPGMFGMDHGAMTAGPAAMPGVPGTPAPARGLAAEQDGYRLDLSSAELPAGRATACSFTITGPDGGPVTDFAEHQSKKLHFYAIRSDLTGFQHLHPTMAADGTWTADLSALAPGDWRLYTSFLPNTGPRAGELVLSRTVTVPGAAPAVPLPAPAGSTTVDGYTVDLRSEPMAGAHRLTATVSRDGRPVTDLQPYLDSYAHLTAFHQGDRALAHLHPTGRVDGEHGGPTLTFMALLGAPGNWRVFLQFQTAGQLHTAELTLNVADPEE
ncbi:hypothetical protein ACIF6L_12085 [Kitasatospora sp. NPDC086009]|uniref:hypothetical protein n=1 Tax=unclassified Kitasatospora TaxID=2633591 RepID=UPI0037CB8107